MADMSLEPPHRALPALVLSVATWSRWLTYLVNHCRPANGLTRARRQDGDLARPSTESAGAGRVGKPDVEDVATHRAAGILDHEDHFIQAFDTQARAKRVQVR